MCADVSLLGAYIFFFFFLLTSMKIQPNKFNSSMRCGSDAHGGNDQNGCGANFNWQTAPVYSSANKDGPAARKHLQFQAAEPKKAMQLVWPLDESGDANLPCDLCGNVVRGPLFSCINCRPQRSFCVKCEGVARDVFPQHTRDHVFLIQFPPERERESKSDSPSGKDAGAGAGGGGGGGGGDHGAGGTPQGKCATAGCSCAKFKPHPFKKRLCNDCFHFHAQR